MSHSYDFYQAVPVFTGAPEPSRVCLESLFKAEQSRATRLKQARDGAPQKIPIKRKEDYRTIVYGSKEAFAKKVVRPDYDILTEIGILEPSSVALPPGAELIRIPFRLITPYISRDDRAFYPIENPVRKEWAFFVPMVSGSTWKGNLRAAALAANVDSLVIHRLFGPPFQESDQELHTNQEPERREGRLHFFPSYFSQIGVDVINPRDPRKRTGKGPIYFEMVPEKAESTLSILYFPFDLIGRPETQAERQQDLELTRGLAVAMLEQFGFGAKKKLGAGRAQKTPQASQ